MLRLITIIVLVAASAFAQFTPSPRTFTIAKDATLSTAAIDLQGYQPVGLELPTWTAADVTFLVSLDGTNFKPLYDGFDTEVSYKAGTGSRIIPLEPKDFLPVRYVKIQSGKTGATVSQVAARTGSLILSRIVK